jgi:uncharacterized protein (TIGR02444 family)
VTTGARTIGKADVANTTARADFRACVWDNMLRLYGVATVPPLCLHLQDKHQADVPLLLVFVLADRVGLGAIAAQAHSLIEGAAFWSDTGVAPLRRLRRVLRDHIADAKDRAFREQVKQLELDAERRHVNRIAAVFETMAGTDPLAVPYLSSIGLPGVEIDATLGVFATACGVVFEPSALLPNNESQ